MSNEVDLGNEPVKHLLFILAVPAIVSQLVNALYNMVDRMYIGHIADIGATALTGVGVCFPIIMIVSAFAYLGKALGRDKGIETKSQLHKDSPDSVYGHIVHGITYRVVAGTEHIQQRSLKYQHYGC